MTSTPTFANMIRLNYIGNDNYAASWIGWPSDDMRRVKSRIISADTVTIAAQDAAELFADWLASPPNGPVINNAITSVTVGQDKPDHFMVAVTVEHKGKAL